jgi:hypothetical protein
MKPFVTTWDTNFSCTGSTQCSILVWSKLYSGIQIETKTVRAETKLNAVIECPLPLTHTIIQQRLHYCGSSHLRSNQKNTLRY